MADPRKVLHAPQGASIEITKWKVKAGSRIDSGTLIMTYKIQGSDDIKKLKAEQIGRVVSLFRREGDFVLPREPLLEIEGCQHAIVMKGMCAECGIDLRAIGEDDRNGKASASVAMVHSVPELIVSEKHALEIGRKDEQKLLQSGKLVLLVDLDQTLIHTTMASVPSDIKDVYHYQMSNGPAGGIVWYHTRLRPGIQSFLATVSKMFELHVVTFGIRLYAHHVTSLLDPDGKYFSHRILSRDECFDQRTKTANLKALFPCGDRMVCIIDDRDDVWNNIPNLIQVQPYRFFKGTGDINSPPGVTADPVGISGLNGSEVRVAAGSACSVPLASNRSSATPVPELKKYFYDEKKAEDVQQRSLPNDEASLECNASAASCTTQDGLQGGSRLDGILTHSTTSINADMSSSHTEDVQVVQNKHSKQTAKDKPDVQAVRDTPDEQAAQDALREQAVQCEPKKQVGQDEQTVQDKADEQSAATAITAGLQAPNAKSLESVEDGSVPSVATDDENVAGGHCNLAICKDALEEKEQPLGQDDSDTSVATQHCSDGGQAAATVCSSTEASRVVLSPVPSAVSESAVWEDDDDYLDCLVGVLTRVHHSFYAHEGVVGGSRSSAPAADLRTIIPNEKKQSLAGCSVTFSGVFPTTVPLQKSLAFKMATTLGASVGGTIDDSTTHLVAARLGTQKVKQAVAHLSKDGGGMYVVHPNWLWACWYRWQRVSELSYLLTKDNEIPEPTRQSAVDGGAGNGGGGEFVNAAQLLKRKLPESNDEEASRKRQKAAEGASLNIERASIVELNGGGEERTSAAASSIATLAAEETLVNANVPVAPSSDQGGPAVSKSFSESYSPLMALDSEQLQSMDKEVEDMFDEESSNSGSSSSTSSSHSAKKRLRNKVLSSGGSSGGGDESSSSSESLTGDYPRGWRPRKRLRDASHDEGRDDDELEVADLEAEEESRTLEAETSDDDGAADNDDDDMVAAVEKELFS